MFGPRGGGGGGGRGGRRGDGGLAAGGLLVGHGGAAVQLGVDEAAAAPDVVHAAAPRHAAAPPLVGQRQGEAGRGLLGDGADALVAEATLQDVLGWGGRGRSLTDQPITRRLGGMPPPLSRRGYISIYLFV